MTPKRADANQPAIVAALRQAGRKVQDTHAIGQGFPDLAVLTPRGQLVLLEVKVPGRGLTARERRWHAEWAAGPVFVVYTVEGALEVTR